MCTQVDEITLASNASYPRVSKDSQQAAATNGAFSIAYPNGLRSFRSSGSEIGLPPSSTER